MLPRRAKETVFFVGVSLALMLSAMKELVKVPNVDPCEQLLNSSLACPSATLSSLCIPLTAAGSWNRKRNRKKFVLLTWSLCSIGFCLWYSRSYTNCRMGESCKVFSDGLYLCVLGTKMKIWQLSLEESELWDIWGKSQGTGGNSFLASAAAKTWSCFSLKIWRKILVFPFTASLGMCKWKRERQGSLYPAQQNFWRQFVKVRESYIAITNSFSVISSLLWFFSFHSDS